MTTTQGEHAQPEALRTIAEWPITDPSNMDAVNMAAVARAALTAAPQGGAYAELPAIDWSQAGLLMEAHATTREFVTGTTNWAVAICKYMAERASNGQAPAGAADLRKALQFYADGDHFIRSDADAWDTVSGEPPNYWCDEAGTATVEDGSIARLALAGHRIKFEDENTAPTAQPAPAATFQQRVQPWLLECFGAEIAADRVERNHRFLEEALELVQSLGCTASEAHQLVDYVFGRPVGDPPQEAGGVMVTLAALCLANGLDMHDAGEVELARISVPEIVAKIRAKQAAKPKHSPLPQSPTPQADSRPAPDAWDAEDTSKPRSRADLRRVLTEWNETTGALPRDSGWFCEVLGMMEDAYDLATEQFHYDELAAEVRRIALKPGSVAVSGTLLRAAAALAARTQADSVTAPAAKGDEQKALAALRYYKTECSGAEPSMSVFHRMVDEALEAAPAASAVAGPGGKCMGPRCMACVENGYAHSRECIDEAGETQGWKPTAEDYAKCGPSAAAPTPAAPHPIAPDVAADLERSDWTPEEALRWYAAGKHYDTVPNCDGTSSARILDNGAVASNALKSLSRDYAEHKGDVALMEAPAAGAVSGPTVRKVFLVATGEEYEGEATYTRYDDAPPPLCDSECLYTAAPTPAAQFQGEALTQAARDVLAERQRQISAESWTPEHDDDHAPGELAIAGACYAAFSKSHPRPGYCPGAWPWSANWWKPSPDPRRNLIKANALLLAELERMDRADASNQGAA